MLGQRNTAEKTQDPMNTHHLHLAPRGYVDPRRGCGESGDRQISGLLGDPGQRLGDGQRPFEPVVQPASVMTTGRSG